MELSYSREFEKEADDFVIEEMHRFGISFDYFASIMRRLEKFYLDKNNHAEKETSQHEKSISDFLSTPPPRLTT